MIGHALRGITLMLRTQHNAWVHAAATVLVVAAGPALLLDASYLLFTAPDQQVLPIYEVCEHVPAVLKQSEPRGQCLRVAEDWEYRISPRETHPNP